MDEHARQAFEEIHHITLGRDATADTVVAELALIEEISGGKQPSSTVRRCKYVNEAVLHTSSWLRGR